MSYITHGMSGSRLMTCYWNMRMRAGRAKYHKHVSICKAWMRFEPFMRWALDNGYRDDLSLDRIDNSKGYLPSNCRWATAKEQAVNRRNTIFVDSDGRRVTLKDHCKTVGLCYGTIRYRIGQGLTVEQALAMRWNDRTYNIGRGRQ